MAEGYTFRISGDVANYAKEISKIPGVTDKAAASAALKMGQQFAKMETDTAKKAKVAAKEAGDAWKGVGEAAKAGGFGGLSEQVDHASKAFAALAADPLTAVAAGFTAVAAAGAGGIAALGAATLAADDALESLKGFKAIGSDFYPKVPPDALQSIKDVNAAMDALISIGQRLVVDVGANVAPAFAKAADAAVGLSLEAMDLFEAFAKGRNLLEDFAVFMTEGFVSAVLSPITPLEGLAKAVVYLSEVAGIELPASAKDALTAFGELNHTLAKSAVTTLEDSAAAKSLGAALEGASARGESFIRTQERVTAAQKNGAKAAKEAAEAQKKAAADYKVDLAEEEKAQAAFASGMAALAAESKKSTDAQLSGVAAVKQAYKEEMTALLANYQATLQQSSGDQQRLAAIQAFEQAKAGVILEYEGKVTAAQKTEDDKRAEDLKKSIESQAAIQQSYASSVASIFGTIADAAGEAMGAIDPKKHKAAYMAAFDAQKAAAIAQAGLNTFMMVSNALALPIPPPGPEIAAIAAGLAGGVQMAKIAAAPRPKFHTGTMYASPSGALRADEFQATLQRGEIVVDRQTASRPGVREAVAAMATGTTSRATHPDDVAEGMDRSSVPMLLQSLLVEFRRMTRPTPNAGRPGHRPSYGY
jgi:hypothetical protein